MKSALRHLCLFLMSVVLLGSIQSASAIAYRFWQSQWDGGGTLSGTLEIDESMANPPGTPFEGSWALITFHAHWSGNDYSQPYDWGIDDVSEGPGFMWNIERHFISGLELGQFGSVYYDSRILWDARPTCIPNFPPFSDVQYEYRTASSEGLHGEVVPDSGSTLLLLGIALIALFSFASKPGRTLARWIARPF
ncbi:MAG TPA: VPDSG-CTERM sorting domain-containing protein [Verrucomicrobiae bacterium]|nr:VPDSG-CTERM sorting domain-containing protein [Verrucomicrobiae bacterium]